MFVDELDPILYNLYMCEKTLNDCVEITDYDLIFEANTPGIQSSVINNEENVQKSKGFLMKAFEAIKTLIQTIINGIVNFFGRMGMDKKTRQAFDMFKEAAKRDPSLNNAQINVFNWKQYQAKYEELYKRQQEADRALKLGKVVDISKWTNDASFLIKSIAGGAAGAVLMQFAENIAVSSIPMAKFMTDKMKNDKKLIAELESTMGKAQTAVFKSKIKSCTHRVSLMRTMSKLNKTYSDSIMGALKSTFNQMGQLTSNVGSANTMLKKMMEIIKNPVGRKFSFSSNVTNTVGSAIPFAMQYNKGKKKYKKDTKKAIKQKAKEDKFKSTHKEANTGEKLAKGVNLATKVLSIFDP